jgi:phage-related protein
LANKTENGLRMTVAITFNSATIPGVQDISQSFNTRTAEITIPRRDGGFMDSSPNYDARTITVKGVIAESNFTTLRTTINTLNTALNTGIKRFTMYSDRYINCCKKSFDITYPKGFSGRVANYTIQFIATDPFWYGYTAETASLSVAPANPENRYDEYITASGNAPCSPVFTFTCTSTMTFHYIDCGSSAGGWGNDVFYSENIDVGTNNTNFLSGDVLVIDCSALTCILNGSNALNKFSMSGKHLYLIGGETTTIEIVIVAVAGCSGGANLVISWYPRWY